ncbi:glutathione S-transferase family protein [Pararhizobium mangrovi]|uniref:Glutathione S-transferase family protein n=1 Tax=Pararhizobium mangrovi TaxID=2590452 RepID=A0A506U9B7_9HYPH|nr:glutathione S-transferase family protein [Pararhizobium mangrovi]TPW29956.1 glutathione S-transferase family protein [Pararhizobium mangrovi]
MADMILYGFDGSTYVRTVRMLLAAKGAEYEQVPVNVLKGEPRQPEHLERNPFGKVPVLDVDGMRLIETNAIARYLNDTLSGPSFVPQDAKDRARMDMTIGIVDSYAYGALLGGLLNYHLFAESEEDKDEDARKQGIDDLRLSLREIMKLRGDDPWIAGDAMSLADLYLAPLCFYVEQTPDKETVLDVPGLADWWQRMKREAIYTQTEPDLG